jgi:ABC-type Fe3+-hydroxamate transport system substrate-binding protein
MKKTVAFILALVMTVSLAACSSNGADSSNSADSAQAAQAPAAQSSGGGASSGAISGHLRGEKTALPTTPGAAGAAASA